MPDIASFESALKAVVQAKRLSGSKMTALTADAMQLLAYDTQLVSILYRTHKSLSGSSKISSLYVFDSFARAARSKANKQGSSGSGSSGGNAHSFLSKLEGVLDGLFHDMVTCGLSEGKEKANKIIDIWSKGNTFPPSVLSGLMATVSANEKESDVAKSSDPRIRSTSTSQTPPNAPLAPSVQANAARAFAPPTQSTPGPAPADAQAALLALLTQAAAAKQPSTQTPTNNTPPQLDPTHLALIQQLSQAAQHATPPPAPTTFHQPQPGYNAQPNGGYPHPSTSQSPPYEGNGPYGRRDYRQDRPGSVDRPRPYEDYPYDDRGGGRGRGFRGGFRGRGRGDGRGNNRWEDRSKPREWINPRRSSRSRSPPSRYGRPGRDIKPYSPPHRPSLARSPSPPRGRDPRLAMVESGKDEFGRDIRSPSPEPPDATPPPAPPSSQDEKSVPVSSSMPVSAMPMFTSVPANTSSAGPPVQVRPAGIESFDPSTFDFTAEASWEALGHLWHKSYGVMPSTEELMQFVVGQTQQQQWGAAGRGMGGGMDMGMGQGGMGPGGAQGGMGIGGMGMGQQGAGMVQGIGMDNNMGGGDMGAMRGQRWRGGARGARGGFRGRGGFGNGRGDFTHSAAAQNTDAIVLGGDTTPPQMPNDYMVGTGPMGGTTSMGGAGSMGEGMDDGGDAGGGPGGRMQKIGDRWVFVRQGAASA
ncbi:hypothetical protein BD626DRAFT_634468 [Schizophyllum amplum]|uniref:CID domain-containing protein n=1 Tax=Schizophyllum amplum TaxID=97359 RepID=A0A550BZF8_9AGAR|nr:hypothetical protein BD626DRAFT_634468 [Auriculariopsis ampla]